MLKREGNTAWKVSKNDKNLIFRNFLPIKNQNIFDEMNSYLQNLINENKLRDISSLRQEKNGTIILENNNGNKYGIYNGKNGYVRFIKPDFKKEIFEILNKDIKYNEESSGFYEAIEPLETLENQLHIVVKHIIYNS